MKDELRNIADSIIDAAIKAVLPDEAVKRALENKELAGKVVLVAAGKAAWQMAKAASDYLGDRIDKGVVITKLSVLRQVIPYRMRTHLMQHRKQ